MNHGNSIALATGAIVNNAINSIKVVLKLCEMKGWKSTVFLLSFFTIVLVGCVAVLLIVGDPPDEDHDGDVPLHPIASSSYPNSLVKSSRSNADTTDDDNEDHQDGHHLHEHRHNYRRRFTDAIKGVFADLINNKNESSTSSTSVLSSSSPSYDDTDNTSRSTENSSSRLKRQLDFGSNSSEEQNNRETFQSTEPPVKKYTPPSKRPFLRIISTLGTNQVDNSPQQHEAQDRNDEGSEEDTRGKNGVRKNIRRFRPNGQRRPKLQSLSSKEKYDVSDEDEEDNEPYQPRKNFTLEVVQVQRKVTRKEDSHIPPQFKKGKYNIEPSLAKVNKVADINRPRVVYKNSRAKINSSPIVTRPPPLQTPPPLEPRHLESFAPPRIFKEASNSQEQRKLGGFKNSEEKSVVVKLPHTAIAAYNDKDLSEEDLRDYRDGHTTFGSKGNFTHTILSRNLAGFKPNHSDEDDKISDSNEEPDSKPVKSYLRKSERNGKGGGGVIIIEKGRVTEKYPKQEDENPFQNPNTEIYSVPGGRISSTENYSPKQDVFRSKGSKKNHGGGANSLGDSDDKTSPAIPSSLEELYRQGHPGVLPAPKSVTHKSNHPLSDPYGDSAYSGSPFKYDPLVDDPPLKFDPESDRFYGEPVPDTKDRVAQSNKVEVENRKAAATTTDGNEKEENGGGAKARFGFPADDDSESRESPERGGGKDRFFYGRSYNPPDYNSEYDTEPAAGNDRKRSKNDKENENDIPSYDFVGLDDNYDQSPDYGGSGGGRVSLDSDFFDFPEDLGNIDGRGGSSRSRSGSRSSKPRDDDSYDNDDRKTNDKLRKPPPPENEDNDYDDNGTTERDSPQVSKPRPRANTRNKEDDADYDSNNDFGFGPTPRKIIEDDEPNPAEIYDNGFIHTLKQFDEEIKKLQDEERQKLLHTTALPKEGQPIEANHGQPPPSSRSSTAGYKRDPPLIITSPGPIEPSYENAPPEVSSTPVNNIAPDIPITGDNPFENEPTDSREDTAESGLPSRGFEDYPEERNNIQNGFFDDYFSTENAAGEVSDEIKK